MFEIHQFVAGFSNGDAISNEARLLRSIFRSWGFRSEIFSETRRILPELRREVADVAAYLPVCRSEHVVLLHLSIGSRVNEVFATLPAKKVILYHNITPAEYFRAFNPETARDLERGREQVRRLANVADINLADSRFNADELKAYGYGNVQVLPLILDLKNSTSAVDRRILRKYRDGTHNVLFVGRCAPNKKIEDAILAFDFLRRFVEPNSRFIHVGSYSGTEHYYYLVLAQARELDITNVVFAGAVSQPQLNAFYQCADVFLCMSEHEGFCIPVIESMAHNVPVMAYAAGAVPETMAGAGILFREKNFPLIAEMLGRLIHDSNLRQAVLQGQRQRLAGFLQRDVQAELRACLAPLLPSCCRL